MRSILICICILFASALWANDVKFLSKRELKELNRVLFSEIERLDASAIEVRNKSKRVKWSEFKRSIEKKIKKSEDWESLYAVIRELHFGFTNLHSYIAPAGNSDREFEYTVSPKIGFNYPDLSFNLLQTYEAVTQINGQDINGLFEKFEDYQCRRSHTVSCAHEFSNRFNSGELTVLGKAAEFITVKRKDKPYRLKLSKEPVKNVKDKKFDCKKVAAQYSKWNLSYSGGMSCLFHRGDIALIKIDHFGAWGGDQNDFYCKNKRPEKKSMCDDIQKISAMMKKMPLKTLIVDVQNNRGGTEGTPFVAALSNNEFIDNIALYKKTKEIENEEFRKGVFYYNYSGERWFKGLVDSNLYGDIAYGEYLPMRGDFCRGSNDCRLRSIKPNELFSITLPKIYILSNYNCVSSCDDLLARLSAYSNATVVGQTPATDGTYARVQGEIYLSKNREIKSIIHSEIETMTLPEGSKLIVEFQVPYSRTVDRDGELLDGDSSILDHFIPVDIKQFSRLESYNLEYLYHKIMDKSI